MCATGIACRKEVEDGEILEASASGIMSDVSVDDDSAGCLTTGRTFRTGRKCCSGQMLSDHLGVTDHGHGRESNKWLLENRSIERDKVRMRCKGLVIQSDSTPSLEAALCARSFIVLMNEAAGRNAIAVMAFRFSHPPGPNMDHVGLHQSHIIGKVQLISSDCCKATCFVLQLHRASEVH